MSYKNSRGQRWLICKPKTNKSDVKEFHVNVDDAKAQAMAVGFTMGKSGDPHEFKNTDKILWGVEGCNKLEADMYEYPEKERRSSSGKRTKRPVIRGKPRSELCMSRRRTNSSRSVAS